MDGEKKTIELTREQFLALMKVVYLGNWIANSHLIGDDKREDIETVEDVVFAKAKEFGFERYVDHEATDDDRFFPTRYFEEETGVEEMIAEYDNETFWDEISDRLGVRDFVNTFGEQTINSMSRNEHFDRLTACTDKWEDEFEAHGIDRLTIADKSVE
jgi:hypothetical protein